MKDAVRYAVCFCALLLAAANAPAQESVRAYYFGNSLTGCTDPHWHAELGTSAGKTWEAEANLGAGWQLWQHREEIEKGGVDFDRGSKGDLTLDPEQFENAGGKINRFLNEKWDAMVLQPFSLGLAYKTKEMSGKTFDREKEVGDVQASIDLIDAFLKLNPEGRVFIYQDWPKMEAGAVPPDEELPEWARTMKAERGSIRTAEFPDRAGFDYRQAWLLDQYEPTSDPERWWLHKNARSKDYHEKLFAALKAHYPKLYEERRLNAIPVGDIFLALDEKMQAGEVPGLESIEDFYTDVQHIRAGLPRYTAAASFYAALFGEHPGKLDWKLYNSEERYAKRGPDTYHDRGELLEITPERARVVNDAVWAAVSARLGRGE